MEERWKGKKEERGEAGERWRREGFKDLVLSTTDLFLLTHLNMGVSLCVSLSHTHQLEAVCYIYICVGHFLFRLTSYPQGPQQLKEGGGGVILRDMTLSPLCEGLMLSIPGAASQHERTRYIPCASF